MEPTVEKGLAASLYQHLEHGRNILDQRALALQEELRVVYTLRNTKAPINARLPPETLSRVFFYVKNFTCRPLGDPCRRRSRSSYNHPFVILQWVRCLTHVCRHWRSVALLTPSLRTDGFPVSLDGVRAFLERSGNQPIVFDELIMRRIWSHPQLYSLIMAYIGRAREIEIIAYCEAEREVLSVLDIDMSHLSVLIVKTSHSMDPDNKDTPSLPRPENLNRVRHLRLNCGFNWDYVQLANLTVLELQGDPNPAHNVSSAQILDVLRKSPGLQTLNLRDIVHDSPSIGQTDPKDISMPTLQELQLCQTDINFAHLLVCSANLPELKMINIEITTSNAPVFTDLLVSAARKLNRYRPTSIDIVLADPRDENSFTCEYYYNELLVNLRFCNFEPDVDTAQATLLFFGETDLSYLDDLRCAINRAVTIEWWEDMLNRANALSVLKIESLSYPSNFLSALTPYEITEIEGTGAQIWEGDASSVTGNRSPFILPSLRRLIFSEMDFTFTQPTSADHFSLDYTPGSLNHLAHRLEQRIEYGSILDLLTIPESDEDHHASGAHLEKHVRQLSCKGEQDNYDPEPLTYMWMDSDYEDVYFSDDDYRN